MRAHNTTVCIASIATASVVGAAARGAPVQFFGEDFIDEDLSQPHPNTDQAASDFFSNLSGVATEDFESFPVGGFTSLPITFGSDTATIVGANTEIENNGDGFPISGSQYVESEFGGGQFTINFSSPQAAFGFFGSDIGDSEGQLSLELQLVGGGTQVIDVPHTFDAPDDSLLFFGLIATQQADTFTSVRFFDSIPDSGDTFGFDDLVIGRLEQVTAPDAPPPNIIPTPAAAPIGCALLALVAARRRRRGSGG